MALPFYNWSRTAASNASADATVNWAEGQAPSSVNDSARAMMASTAAFRDDISGAIVTAGTSTAYTVTSFQIFDSLAHMNGAMVAFTPHATNTGTTTLNVDGLGGKPLRGQPSVELPSGSLILGTPYVATYNNSDAAWYLQSGAANAYGIPLGGLMDYIGPTAPNGAFVLPIGQAISRTTFATLFSLISTTYGVGDGSTTFNVPDLTGRVVAMKEASATRLTTAKSGIDGSSLGAANGLTESVTMARANMPDISLTVGGSLSVVSTPTNVITGTLINPQINTSGGVFTTITAGTGASGTITSTGTLSTTTNSLNGSVTQTVMNNVQPTIVLNKILRVI